MNEQKLAPNMRRERSGLRSRQKATKSVWFEWQNVCVCSNSWRRKHKDERIRWAQIVDWCGRSNRKVIVGERINCVRMKTRSTLSTRNGRKLKRSSESNDESWRESVGLRRDVTQTRLGKTDRECVQGWESVRVCDRERAQLWFGCVCVNWCGEVLVLDGGCEQRLDELAISSTAFIRSRSCTNGAWHSIRSTFWQSSAKEPFSLLKRNKLGERRVKMYRLRQHLPAPSPSLRHEPRHRRLRMGCKRKCWHAMSRMLCLLEQCFERLARNTPPVLFTRPEVTETIETVIWKWQSRMSSEFVTFKVRAEPIC